MNANEGKYCKICLIWIFLHLKILLLKIPERDVHHLGRLLKEHAFPSPLPGCPSIMPNNPQRTTPNLHLRDVLKLTSIPKTNLLSPSPSKEELLSALADFFFKPFHQSLIQFFIGNSLNFHEPKKRLKISTVSYAKAFFHQIKKLVLTPVFWFKVILEGSHIWC